MLKDRKHRILNRINKNLDSISDPSRKNLMIDLFEKVNKLFYEYKYKVKKEKLYLAHNDPNPTNFLFLSDQNRFKLIDFEYAGYNPFGMDVLNLINEYMINYKVENSPDSKIYYENFPKKDFLLLLIRYYIYFSKNDIPDMNLTNIKCVQYDIRFTSIEESEVKNIYDRFNYFGILCNIFWFYWALYQHS